MAHADHLHLLRQGVEHWNRWRWREPKVQPNLRRADLYEADLSRAKLSQAFLHRANLGKADLSRASLHRADLSETDLSGADLSRADLTQAILCRANLEGVKLSGARFERTDLRGLPWLLIMELTRQPGITWQDVLYDRLPADEPAPTDQSGKEDEPDGLS